MTISQEQRGEALALVFSLKLVSAQDWGACVPSRHRTTTEGKSPRMVEPLRGPMEEGQQVDRSSHRLPEASPE